MSQGAAKVEIMRIQKKKNPKKNIYLNSGIVKKSLLTYTYLFMIPSLLHMPVLHNADTD